MNQTYCFHGRVLRSLWAGRPCLSQSKVFAMLDTYADFSALAQLPGATPGTRFLTYAQVNDLLERVLASAAEHLPGVGHYLIGAKMPSSIPFTERLLRPDVLMCHAVEAESMRLVAQGGNFLAIVNGWTRNPLEHGDNRLHITWHGAPSGAAAAFDRFTTALAGHGIDPA